MDIDDLLPKMDTSSPDAPDLIRSAAVPFIKRFLTREDPYGQGQGTANLLGRLFTKAILSLDLKNAQEGDFNGGVKDRESLGEYLKSANQQLKAIGWDSLEVAAGLVAEPSWGAQEVRALVWPRPGDKPVDPAWSEEPDVALERVELLVSLGSAVPAIALSKQYLKAGLQGTYHRDAMASHLVELLIEAGQFEEALSQAKAYVVIPFQQKVLGECFLQSRAAGEACDFLSHCIATSLASHRLGDLGFTLPVFVTALKRLEPPSLALVIDLVARLPSMAAVALLSDPLYKATKTADRPYMLAAFLMAATHRTCPTEDDSHRLALICSWATNQMLCGFKDPVEEEGGKKLAKGSREGVLWGLLASFFLWPSEASFRAVDEEFARGGSEGKDGGQGGSWVAELVECFTEVRDWRGNKMPAEWSPRADWDTLRPSFLRAASVED